MIVPEIEPAGIKILGVFATINILSFKTLLKSVPDCAGSFEIAKNKSLLNDLIDYFIVVSLKQS